MDIAFVSRKLSNGGSERAVAEMAGYWAVRGESVTVITFGEPTPNEYPLDDRVARIELNIDQPGGARRYFAALRAVWKLRRTLREVNPDVVIGMSVKASLLAILAMVGTKTPVIGEEIGAFPVIYHHRRVSIVRAILYPLLQAFVVQSDRTREAAGRLARDPRKVRVIPRHVSPSLAADDAPRSPSAWSSFPGGATAIRIVAVGRLERQKGFDLLLEALALLADDERWGLVILGEGTERHSLQAQATKLGLDHRVRLAGWTDDPRPTLWDSSIFVLSSRFEGFPQALIEAMANDLAVVAFDCPTGPSDIITPELDGILVTPNDTHALAAAIRRLIDDDALRARLALAARAVRDRNSIERVMPLWDQLLVSVCGASR